MKVTPTAIPGVLVFEPTVFGDERGFFMESFNQRAFDEAVGRHVEFVQDNHSRSAKGAAEGCIRWDDPSLAIDWPDVGTPLRISQKDAEGLSLTGAPTFVAESASRGRSS